MNNNTESGGRYNYNRQNNNSRYNNKYGHGGNDQQKSLHFAKSHIRNTRHNRERERKENGVTIRYDRGKISENKVNHSFLVYGETNETKVKHTNM